MSDPRGESRWTLRVVGESVLLDPAGVPCDLSAKSKRFAVLVFLALPTPGRWIRRDVLLATFWPELDSLRARSALRSTLHQLRNTLGPDAIDRRGDEEVCLDGASVRLDLVDLQSALASGDTSAWLARPSLELVPGLHVPDAAPFHEWLDAQRHALNTLIVSAAWKAADAATAVDIGRARDAARLATRLAPEDEPGRRRLITLLDQCGDRAGALAEFEQFETWLREEFQVSPSPETIALVQRVRERQPTQQSAKRPTAHVETSETIPARQVPSGAPTVALTRSRGTRWLLPVATFAAVAILLASSTLRHGPFRATGPSAPVAILPLTSEIRDSALAYVAPALGESIADELSSAVVVPFDATRSIDVADKRAVHERLRALGARTVVTGSIGGKRDSLELRLTIENADRTTVHSRLSVVGREDQLVRLRDSAVLEVRRLTGIPAPSADGRHVPPPEAMRLHLAARYLNSRRSRAELLEARRLYTRALEMDPQWSELWLGLARVTGALSYRHFIDYRSGLRESEHDANEAIALAPHDARALMERAMARFQLGDKVGAEADTKRSEALDSTDWHMQSLIGTWWQWSGSHLDSALFYTERARRIAPWDRQTAINILQIVGCMKDSAAIIERAHEVLDIDPNEPETLETLAWTLARFGRWDDATRYYEQRYAPIVASGVTAGAKMLSGEKRFRATVASIRRAVYDEQRRNASSSMPLLESRIALFEDLGMRDSSIATLAAVVDSLDSHHANMMCAPNLRGFRADPRVLAIVKRRGWPLAEFAPAP